MQQIKTEFIKHLVHKRIKTLFDELPNLTHRNKKIFGYSNDVLKRRVLQKISWEVYPRLMNELAKPFVPGGLISAKYFPKKVVIDKSNHYSVNISFLIFFINILKSLKYTLYVVVGSLKSIFSSKDFNSSRRKICVVANISPESFIPSSQIPSALHDFFSNGPITELHDQDRIFIITSNYELKYKNFIFTKNPIWLILQDARITRSETLCLILSTIISLLKFILASLRNPLLSFLFKDIALLESIKLINSKEILSSWVLSNSDYLNQEIWLQTIPHNKKKFDTHMVWYSANSIGLTYKDGPQYAELPFMHYTFADHHWVWNIEQKKWLESIIPTKHIHIAGPVMWYLSDKKPRTKNEVFKVIVFDVSPMKDAFVKDFFSELTFHYYSEDTMCKFILDTVEAVNKIQVKPTIIVKSKRHSKHHSESYLEMLKNLESKSTIELLAANADIFEAVYDSDLCVVIPFSSPAYIAEDSNIPTIFYDPINVIDFSERKKYSKCSYIQNKNIFQDKVLAIYEEWKLAKANLNNRSC